MTLVQDIFIHGTVGKHMLLIIYQMVGRNAEYPCGKGAFLFKR